MGSQTCDFLVQSLLHSWTTSTSYYCPWWPYSFQPPPWIQGTTTDGASSFFCPAQSIPLPNTPLMTSQGHKWSSAGICSHKGILTSSLTFDPSLRTESLLLIQSRVSLRWISRYLCVTRFQNAISISLFFADMLLLIPDGKVQSKKKKEVCSAQTRKIDFTLFKFMLTLFVIDLKGHSFEADLWSIRTSFF